MRYLVSTGAVALVAALGAAAPAQAYTSEAAAGQVTVQPLAGFDDPTRVGLSESRASTDGDGAASGAPISAETPVGSHTIGSSQSGSGRSDDGVASTGPTAVGSGDVAPSSSSVSGNGAESRSALTRVDLVPIPGFQVWVLRSDASASDEGGRGSTSAVLLQVSDHELRVLPTDASTGAAPSTALAEADGIRVADAGTAGGNCAIDVDAGLALNCLEVTDGGTVRAARLAGVKAAPGQNVASEVDAFSAGAATGQEEAAPGSAVGDGSEGRGDEQAANLATSPGTLPRTGAAVLSLLATGALALVGGLAALRLRARRWALG